MRVIFGEIITEGRGRSGGQVLSINRYGQILYNYRQPVNPKSGRRQTYRSYFDTISRAWRDLDPTDLDSWVAAAPQVEFTDRFGNPYNPSPFELFCSCNQRLKIYNNDFITVIPSVTLPDILPTFQVSAEVNPSRVTLTFNSTIGVGSSVVVIYASPNMSPGRFYCKSQYREITFFDALPADEIVFDTAYDNVFQPLISGQKLFVKCFSLNKDNGLTKEGSFSTVIIT